MKPKFIIILVIQGIIMVYLIVYAVYQQTEARRQEALAVELANHAQNLNNQLEEARTIAEQAQKEAEMQRMMCEERLQQATKK